MNPKERNQNLPSGVAKVMTGASLRRQTRHTTSQRCKHGEGPRSSAIFFLHTLFCTRISKCSPILHPPLFYHAPSPSAYGWGSFFSDLRSYGAPPHPLLESRVGKLRHGGDYARKSGYIMNNAVVVLFTTRPAPAPACKNNKTPHHQISKREVRWQRQRERYSSGTGGRMRS